MERAIPYVDEWDAFFATFFRRISWCWKLLFLASVGVTRKRGQKNGQEVSVFSWPSDFRDVQPKAKAKSTAASQTAAYPLVAGGPALPSSSRPSRLAGLVQA